MSSMLNYKVDRRILTEDEFARVLARAMESKRTGHSYIVDDGVTDEQLAKELAAAELQLHVGPVPVRRPRPSHQPYRRQKPAFSAAAPGKPGRSAAHEIHIIV